MPGDSKWLFLRWLSDPVKGLSDLQLGDEKVTLNHLVVLNTECWDLQPTRAGTTEKYM